MFTAGGYKIVFKRRWHEKRERQILFDGKRRISDNNGRYDTVCEVWDTDLNIIQNRGLAKLHPNDKVDKVVGKKVALQNAIEGEQNRSGLLFDKPKRTEIWKAFWAWVKSWNE